MFLAKQIEVCLADTYCHQMQVRLPIFSACVEFAVDGTEYRQAGYTNA
jgi:hypothetical protein